MDTIVGRLKSFDAYPKTLEDFRTKTYGGAMITLISAIIMSLLFLSELNYYLTLQVDQELIVDTMRDQKMKIFLDITFPRIGCPLVSIDAMDVSGESQIDVISNLFKQRLHLNGSSIDAEAEKHDLEEHSSKSTAEKQVNETQLDTDRCESCYGAENINQKCCNTCNDVREAYRVKGWAFVNAENIIQCKREGYSEKLKDSQNEGCRLFGFLLVSKVAGNFHIAPGRSFQSSHVHVHDLNVMQGGLTWNTSHTIQHIGFGEDYPGLVNPLDSTSQFAEKAMMMYTYYVKIVPTLYAKVSGDFSVTKHFKSVGVATGESGLPGVFFIYEFSPMMVKYQEKNRSLFHFLTSLCAIIGGIFTVAGLIDAVLYHSIRSIQKKIELGKVN
ncbi:endoplasmic reticulum-Golgi intermediate compartment protein 3-like isoform X2 [Watersipora subatra]|uniref:endoplasmic reticulum-Golgi intermediate compartment protein 3-like isoform X2 n=1 Tax=Watersipora subatra TaxID=2589382 RepID=UPI00355B029D